MPARRFRAHHPRTLAAHGSQRPAQSGRDAQRTPLRAAAAATESSTPVAPGRAARMVAASNATCASHRACMDWVAPSHPPAFPGVRAAKGEKWRGSSGSGGGSSGTTAAGRGRGAHRPALCLRVFLLSLTYNKPLGSCFINAQTQTLLACPLLSLALFSLASTKLNRDASHARTKVSQNPWRGHAKRTIGSHLSAYMRSAQFRASSWPTAFVLLQICPSRGKSRTGFAFWFFQAAQFVRSARASRVWQTKSCMRRGVAVLCRACSCAVDPRALNSSGSASVPQLNTPAAQPPL
jgi:hypothetical protein